ncbi:MAG TPA: hypothetical protein VI072_31200 [Polyangiaceae bacterium]
MANLWQQGAPTPSYALMTDAQRVLANISDPNLVWIGPAVSFRHGSFPRVHAPNPLLLGSSVSHFSSSMTPNQVLEPFYTGPLHDYGLALDVLSDVGWSVHRECAAPAAVPALPGWAPAVLGILLPALARVRLRRRGDLAAS